MKYIDHVISGIKRRFIGDYRDEFVRSFSAKKYAGDPLKTALRKKRGYLLARNFFIDNCRSKQYYDYYLKVYDTLCAIYTDNSDTSRFDFDDVLVPKPLNEQSVEALFALEFIDILLPYIVDDKVFCDAIAREGPYELGYCTIKPGDIAIDCGANIGLFSALASNKGAIVYAFEPSGSIVDNYLAKTALYNPNVHIRKYALSDKREQLMFVDESTFGAGTRKLTATDVSEKGITEAISIDEFVQEEGITHIDFIKADIEGAERYMLMGAKQVLKEFAPKLSICTYHLPDDRKVLRELILNSNPSYVIEEKFCKMYAHVPR